MINLHSISNGEMSLFHVVDEKPFLKIFPRKKIEACALGQAALNLGYVSEHFVKSNWIKAIEQANNRLHENFSNTLMNKVMALNDRENLSLSEIAQALRASKIEIA